MKKKIIQKNCIKTNQWFYGLPREIAFSKKKFQRLKKNCSKIITTKSEIMFRL